jgi:hypothetical protein
VKSVVGLIALGAVLAGVGFLGAGGFASGNSAGTVTGQVAQPAATISPEQARLFGVFRRAQTPADALTRVAEAVASSPGVADAVPSVGLARRAASLGPDEASWVVPAADNQICEFTQIQDAAGGTCMPLGQAQAGTHVSTTSVQAKPGGPATIVVSGLVPDGTINVEITTSTGSVVVAPVRDNVYIVELKNGAIPKSASLQTLSGRIDTQVPFVPADRSP